MNHPRSPEVRCERDPDTHLGRITIGAGGDGRISIETASALAEGFADLARDDAVKVILLTTENENLCAGFELSQLERIYRDAPGGAVRKVPSQRARLMALDSLWWGPDGLYTRILHCPKVTVLAARGLCLETGLYLALCCDLVLAADDARFGNRRWRHVGVDSDVSMLAQAVGLKRAKELLYFGIEWSADEAQRYGLVDLAMPAAQLDAAAMLLASQCTQVMRDGISAEKHVVFAALAKMQVAAGFATATAVGAWASNLHFRPGEFNFLREARDHGAEAALAAADNYFNP
jgi:2-(1,2-epoxy-1,2-dihydrophenyl)acetyl-CoA isomerase